MQNKCDLSQTADFYHGFNHDAHDDYELIDDSVRTTILSLLNEYNNALSKDDKAIVTEDEFMTSAEHKTAAFNLLKDVKKWRELFTTTLKDRSGYTMTDLILEDINNTGERDLAIQELLKDNAKLQVFLRAYDHDLSNQFTATHAVHIFNNLEGTDMEKLYMMARLTRAENVSTKKKSEELAGTMTEEVQNVYDNLEGTDMENLTTMKSVFKITKGTANELAKDLFENMIHEVENIHNDLNGTNIENLKTMNEVWKVIEDISNEASIRVKGESMIGDMTKEVDEIYKNLEGTSEEKVKLIEEMSNFLIKGKAKDKASKTLSNMNIEGVEAVEDILKKDFPNGVFEKFEKIIDIIDIFAYGTKSHNAVVALFRKQTQLVQDFFDALTGAGVEKIEKMHEFTYLIGRCDPRFGAGDPYIKAHKLFDSMTEEVQEAYDSFTNKLHAIQFLEQQSFLNDTPAGKLIIELKELNPETKRDRINL